MLPHEGPAIVFPVELGIHGFGEGGVGAVEKDALVLRSRVVAGYHRRVPMISRKDLVGPLAALDHLHVPGDGAVRR